MTALGGLSFAQVKKSTVIIPVISATVNCNPRTNSLSESLAFSTVKKARRRDVSLHLRPLALEPVKINDATAYLESANRRVVLVLHHDLNAGLRLQQWPAILWRRRNARANQGNYVLKLSDRKHSCQPGQAHAERS